MKKLDKFLNGIRLDEVKKNIKVSLGQKTPIVGKMVDPATGEIKYNVPRKPGWIKYNELTKAEKDAIDKVPFPKNQR